MQSLQGAIPHLGYTDPCKPPSPLSCVCSDKSENPCKHSCVLLLLLLLQVCKNPRNPGFNHYLFESVAALIKFVGSSNPAMIGTFEQLLFPAFNHVLQQVRSLCKLV